MYLYTYIDTHNTHRDRERQYFLHFVSLCLVLSRSEHFVNKYFIYKNCLMMKSWCDFGMLKGFITTTHCECIPSYLIILPQSSYLKIFPLSLLHQNLLFSQVLNLCWSIPNKVFYLSKDHLEVMIQVRLVTIPMQIEY